MNSVPAQNGLLSSSLNFEAKSPERQSKWKRWSRLFGRDDVANIEGSKQSKPASAASPDAKLNGLAAPADKQASPWNRFTRPVIPGLPRPTTFRRQMSERRERLSPSDIPHSERRTVSVDRRRAFSTRPASPSKLVDPRTSAPAVIALASEEIRARSESIPATAQDSLPQQPNINAMLMQRPADPPTPPPDEPSHIPDNTSRRNSTVIDIQLELESKWILNLSMHFRDKSPREKFFVTYAETPTSWRRVTVSCDYRNAPPDSLEADLHALTYQRDKSSRIYEAIRMSLPDIQFYDTVTNLRLETSADERLHVHVTEDVNEIIPYPDKHLLSHLPSIPRIAEDEVHFLNHMSGFVYKVRVGGEILIKKEIPGPDSVEEFLYEINALASLVGSKTVVQIRGLVVDDDMNTITGLLIDYYEQGPLVDILFDHRGSLSWERRSKWAMQIMQGLAEIHEAGFVQGDFTVSNICVGADDDARIIDINRRGCPVGWEPPEIAAMIESGQRISMYIGVKSDLYQLGMVLWAIANEDDEPERRERPLRLIIDPEESERDPAPSWFHHIVHSCLETQPSKRPSAYKLLDSALTRGQSAPTVGFEDALGETTTHTWGSASTAVPTVNLSRYDDSKARSPSISSSAYELPRGRSPPRNTAHLSAEWHRDTTDSRISRQNSFNPETSREDGLGQVGDETAECEPEIVSIDPTDRSWREITVDGRGYIVRNEAFDDPRDSDTEGDGTCDEQDESVAVGEDAFGHHSLHQPIPPAPEVPQAPDPPSFGHVDSGLGEVHISGGLQDHYRDFDLASADGDMAHGHEHERYRPIPSEPFQFRHHDSGLGDMDLETDIEQQLGLSPFDPHAHRSGRRTWTWDRLNVADGSQQQALSIEGSECPEFAARSVGNTEGESEHGGVPLPHWPRPNIDEMTGNRSTTNEVGLPPSHAKGKPQHETSESKLDDGLARQPADCEVTGSQRDAGTITKQLETKSAESSGQQGGH